MNAAEVRPRTSIRQFQQQSGHLSEAQYSRRLIEKVNLSSTASADGTGAGPDGVGRAHAIDGMTGWSYLWFRGTGDEKPIQIGQAFWNYISQGVLR